MGEHQELLPCPFCGSSEIYSFKNKALVECQKCLGSHDTVERWNTRAPAQCTQGSSERAALLKIADEAKVANDVIRLGRSKSGQGHIRVATALHRIADEATRALAPTSTDGNTGDQRS